MPTMNVLSPKPTKKSHMSISKPRLSFWQIINMNVGFFGIQYSFGLQQNSVAPIYSFLHADPENLPILSIAGPITGLLVQPIVGALSDKTWSPKRGRRKPYFMVGALFCSIALLAFPFSSALWMAVGCLWILDVANNTAMEPYRAFVADRLYVSQQYKGFLMQSMFTGLGITLAAWSPTLFKTILHGESKAGIPYWVFGSFFLGAVCSIGSVWWSMRTTPELEPSPEEMEHIKSSKINLFTPFIDIAAAIKHMPKVLWMLGLIYLFQWFAMKIYWDFIPVSLNKTIWNSTITDNQVYKNEVVPFAGQINGLYNLITIGAAILLMTIAKKYAAKWIHAVCLCFGAATMFVLTSVPEKSILLFSMVGLGIAWASMMGVPYLIVAGSIPRQRFGVYMGIINMLIVIPMLLYTVSFGAIYKQLLQGNAVSAIRLAGIMLLIAAVATLLIKAKKHDSEVVMRGGGH
jgi:maltose/moltooligosaccharide transporter